MNHQQQYFDDPSHRYPEVDTINPPLAQQLEMEHLQRSLGTLSGTRILDFGTGSGRVSFWFLKQGYDVTAVDVSPTSLRDLRRLYAKHKKPSWGRLTTTTTLPLAGPFDAIVGADVLHHIDINTYVPKFFRILKPGGTITFSEPNAWHIPWYIHWMKEHIPWEIEKGVLQCTRHNITHYLKQTGFQHITIAGHGLIPTRFFEGVPPLCRFNAFIMGNLPLIRHFTFRFIISASKPM